MSTNQDRIKRAGQLSAAANRQFLSENRELLASFDRETLQKAMLAEIRLHHGAEIAEAEPDSAFYLLIQEEAFLNLLDKGAISPAAGVGITALGETVLAQMRRRTGIGVQELPTPAPVLSPEEQLANEVKNDWKTLPSAQIKQKINASKAYRAMFEKLSATDAINSQVTLHSVIDGVGA